MISIKRIIAIGDIHGCIKSLKDLIKKLDIQKDDIIVFLGDYIDRGKHNYEVIKYLIELQRKFGEENCICLMGNHEQMMLDYLCGDEHSSWLYNGGSKTKKSYHKHKAVITKHLWWLRKLPYYYETEKFVFCHAGMPHKKILQNSNDDLIWDRSHLHCPIKNEKIVVFGHTPTKHISGKWEAFICDNDNICIDTGCVYEGKLCAFVFDGNEYNFVYQDNIES